MDGEELCREAAFAEDGCAFTRLGACDKTEVGDKVKLPSMHAGLANGNHSRREKLHFGALRWPELPEGINNSNTL